MSNVHKPGVPGKDTDPSATITTEDDLIAEVEETLATVDKAMPRAERAAHRRELMTSLNRAVAAAKLLGPEPEDEAPGEPEDEEGPVTEPSRPTGKSLALLSDGSVALSLAYVEGASLEGREVWQGILLTLEETEEALDAMSDAADDAAANIGGSIRWRKGEPEGGGDGDE